jgi:hypothetical protein
MPRYFFNILESNGQLTKDDEGQDLPGLEAAKAAALISARELLAENLKFASDHPLLAVIITNQDGDELGRVSAEDILPEPLI